MARRCGGAPGRLVAAIAMGLLSGCASSAPGAAWSPPSREELAAARTWLDSLRADLGPRTEEIAITVEAPLLPGVMRARGAVAVEPGRAARIILLGPGGTTAADLWMDGERHRLALPARDTISRGRRGEALRGVPIELFRSWFLEPLRGDLLDASIDGPVLRAVLRTRDATLFVRAAKPVNESRARDELVVERVPLANVAPGDAPDIEIFRAARGTSCARVTYERPRLGVRAEIDCTARRPGAAERALLDPDQPDSADPGGDRP